MPASCIICGKHPPIKNSHIVPNFVIKRLKAGNPLRTLVHSDTLNRAFQDGWKGDYLCQQCEGNLSRVEAWFCKNIYDPWLAGNEIDVSHSEELGLFAASLAFRYLHYGQENNPTTQIPDELQALGEDLRAALDGNSLNNLRARSYIQFLAPVDTLGAFPPGINTYLFEAIDGKMFTYVISPPPDVFWIIYVKLPGMFFLTSLFDRRNVACALVEPLGYRIEAVGHLQSKFHTGNQSIFVNDIFIERTAQIQGDYGRMPPERLARNLERISKTPNPQNFRAHQTHMLDVKLLSALRAKHSAGSP